MVRLKFASGWSASGNGCSTECLKGPGESPALSLSALDEGALTCELGCVGKSRKVSSPLCVVVALTALLLSAAPAGASTITLRGTVPGDANAAVSMKIVKVRGTPVKAKRIEFKRLDHRCSDGTVRQLNVRLAQTRILKVGITAKYTFFAGISPPSGLPAPNNLNNLFVTGKLRRSAAVVRGTVDSTVRFPPVAPAIANACISSERNYVVRSAS